MRDVPIVAISGGPCAGKTDLLKILPSVLEKMGKSPLIIPEPARMLMRRGIRPEQTGVFPFQLLCASWHLLKRAELLKKAKTLKDPVIIADRGIPENAAYCGKDMYENILNLLNLPSVLVRDIYYTGVVCLVSAAVGAENHYKTDTERRETLEEARCIDSRTIQGWVGHPHLRIISNADANGRKIIFAEKMQRATRAVLQVLGIPEPEEIERRFLVNLNDAVSLTSSFICPSVDISLKQIYLRQNHRKGSRRIRQRDQKGWKTHVYEEKVRTSPRRRIEEGRIISSREFEKLARQEADHKCHEIVKERTYFVWINNGCYNLDELDCFMNPRHLRGLRILEKELLFEDDPIAFPPGIEIVREVTDDEKFSNRGLAQKKLH